MCRAMQRTWNTSSWLCESYFNISLHTHLATHGTTQTRMPSPAMAGRTDTLCAPATPRDKRPSKMAIGSYLSVQICFKRFLRTHFASRQTHMCMSSPAKGMGATYTANYCNCIIVPRKACKVLSQRCNVSTEALQTSKQVLVAPSMPHVAQHR